MRQRGLAVFHRRGWHSRPRVRGEMREELPEKYACMLHDTVLATLTAIASGNLDHRAEEVRHRCARDADHLRRMLASVPDDGSGTADRIAAVVAAAEALGLRVHLRRDALPALPEAVMDALAGAVEEALNNAARHAKVREAWLTLSYDARTLVVRVVDRGAGFDPSSIPLGFGLRHSVEGRVRDAGGRVRITSSPGEGACVELTWAI